MSGNDCKQQLVDRELSIDKNEGTINEEECDDNIDKQIDEHDSVCVDNIEDNLTEEVQNRSNNNGQNQITDDDNNDINDVNDHEDVNDSSNKISLNSCHIEQAINERKSINTIMEYIDLFPMQLKHENSIEKYPLHAAILSDCHDDVLMKLIEAFPEAAQHQDLNGHYPLHLALMSDQSDDRMKYTLHTYIRSDFHVKVLIKLIETFPEAAQHQNLNGQYPLHLALMFYQSDDIVMKLLEVFPQAAFIPTGFGSALHMACQQNLSETIIAKFIEINPLAIQEKDDEASYPIYHAIYRERPNAVIKVLLDADPLGMQRIVECVFNGTPLHLACETKNGDLVKYLLQRSDAEINIRDRHGMTPLHYACNSLRDNIVDILLHHPDVDVNATDRLNETSLHKTIKCFELHWDAERGVNIIQKLLDHSFIIINQKNNDNKTPWNLIKSCQDDYEKRTDHLQQTDERNRRCTMEIVNLFVEFPIKKRWQIYCYLVKNFIANL